jgi:acetyl esterase/lipase
MPGPYAFDPELQSLVDILPENDFSDVEAAREGLEAIIAALATDIDETGVSHEDRHIPGPEGAPDVLVRVYTPDARPTPSPALLDIHGGGFAVGSIAMEHAGAVAFSRNLGVVVVAVEYRLAPEHPFPAGLEDCYAALRWLHASAGDLQLDPARIGIYGQSAGGGLSAGLALLARDRGGPPICFQYLGIPELDDRLETPSMRAFTDTPMWSRPSAELSWRYYLGGDDRSDVSPYAAPSRATDLEGLPPAYVSTMEFDPLRDEGILYAMALMQAGVPVELHSYPGTFHGSALVPVAAVSKRSSVEMMDVLRRGLRVDS